MHDRPDLSCTQDYFGNDFHPSAGPPANSVCGPIAYGENVTACGTRCSATAACAGFVYFVLPKCCFLKLSLGSPSINTALVAYVKSGLGERSD